MIQKLQIGSITFNDNGNYLIAELPGLEMPPIRLTDYNVAGEHFGIYISSFYGKRAFSIKGWVLGADTDDFIAKRDALSSALSILNGEQDIKITLTNGRQIQITGALVNFEFASQPGITSATQFNAQFSASFPFLVGQSEQSGNIHLPAGGGGEVPPPDFPMALEKESGWRITAVNNGNAFFYPYIKIFGPVTNPAIKNETTGKQLRFTCALTSGQYLLIDTKRKTVYDNTGTNRYATKSGDWWFVQPGSNDITFLADTAEALALAQIYWRDSYLGI